MRSVMLPAWGYALVLAGSLGGLASAEEVEGTLACGRCRSAGSCYAPSCRRCYNPCEPVGPIRRFFRRVFLPPCPPAPLPCPTSVVAVVPGPAPYAVVPGPAPAPPPPVSFPGPVEMGQPVPMPPSASGTSRLAPVPPPPGPPATGSSFPRLTPPLPEPPARLDRIASVGGLRGQVLTAEFSPQAHAEVTLVSVERPEKRQRLAADADGRFGLRLDSGAWHVYGRTPDGRWVPLGQVQVQEEVTTRVTLREP